MACRPVIVPEHERVLHADAYCLNQSVVVPAINLIYWFDASPLSDDLIRNMNGTSRLSDPMRSCSPFVRR